jgi:hypothetical protein
MSSEREPRATLYDPLIMGVDVARFGDDRSVIRFRQGRDGRCGLPLPVDSRARVREAQQR